MSELRPIYKEEDIIDTTIFLLNMRDNVEHDSQEYKALQIALDGVGCLPYEK